jgi:NADH:ubiquinone oxidoreductase subunit 4 (subunit M)
VAAAVLAMGVYPKPLINVMHASVADLLQVVARSKL